jgi:hypothetical protein
VKFNLDSDEVWTDVGSLNAEMTVLKIHKGKVKKIARCRDNLVALYFEGR